MTSSGAAVFCQAEIDNPLFPSLYYQPERLLRFSQRLDPETRQVFTVEQDAKHSRARRLEAIQGLTQRHKVTKEGGFGPLLLEADFVPLWLCVRPSVDKGQSTTSMVH